MADASDQERTEEPTARKLQKAREDGQVARSTELPAAAIVIGSFLLMLLAGGWWIGRLSSTFAAGFTLDLKALSNPSLLSSIFWAQAAAAFLVILPLLALTMILAVLASTLTGGFLFAVKALAPKASKIDPVEGLKRVFGPKAAVELFKALVKFALVGAMLWWSITSEFSALLQLGRMELEPALSSAASLIVESALMVALSLAVIAMIDVPWQRRQFIKRMRMTRQEIKDEFKDVEGRPEVKAQIRRRQREMANARMMQRVRDADVIVTNPEHFAVALEYDPDSDRPPIVVAKGADLMAARIREEGDLHGIPRFPAPDLARALFFTTELESPIPEDLYRAVAQVIAYVYSIEGAQPGMAPTERPVPEVPVSMQFDAKGRPVRSEGGRA